MKRISSDVGSSLIRFCPDAVGDIASAVDTGISYQPGQYVACIYDADWHIGNIVDRSDSNHDVLVNFMLQKDNKRFAWPSREDRCWIPFLHVLCNISSPEVEGASARQYKICEKDYDRVVYLFNHRK